MTKISEINKAALLALRPEIDAALKELGERYGLTFKAGSGQYGGARGHFKLEITVDDPAAQEADKRAKWDANGRFIGFEHGGLRPEDFGTEFISSGVRYRAVGLATGRSKFCIEALVLSGPKSGKTLFFTDAVVPLIRAETDHKAAA